MKTPWTCCRVSTQTLLWWLRLFWPAALKHFWLLLSVFRLWCWTRWRKLYFGRQICYSWCCMGVSQQWYLWVQVIKSEGEVLNDDNTSDADKKSKDDISWVFFRSILDSFETHQTPSTQSIPPSVFENATGEHNMQHFPIPKSVKKLIV